MVKPKQLRQAQEDKIKKACTKLQEDQQAGNKLNIKRTTAYYGVPKSTLRGHFRGAHKHQQLLSEHKEQVLVDWIEHLDAAGNPISEWTIKQKCYALCKKMPSRAWIYCFLKQHPSIKLGRPSELDPKCGQCFNRKTRTT